MTLERTNVFISYSHQDKQFLDELQRHLEYFQKNQIIKVWDDQQIYPGLRWQKEILRALAATKVAILLVSADFLGSDFIAVHELPPLLAAAQSGEVNIIPVIIRPCAFSDSKLNVFQSVNTDPLSLLTKAKREQIWTRLTEFVVDIMAN